jgi:hypothetical protein
MPISLMTIYLILYYDVGALKIFSIRLSKQSVVCSLPFALACDMSCQSYASCFIRSLVKIIRIRSMNECVRGGP